MARDRKFGPIKIEQEKKSKKPQEQKKSFTFEKKVRTIDLNIFKELC
jgi:hypothetical protein